MKTSNRSIYALAGVIVAACAAVAPAGAHAEAWSLDSCITYAVAHNISVRQQALQIDDSELTVTQAKDAFLPTFSADASESFNFGRGLTADNTYADRNTTNFQWGVSLNLPLFQGLENVRRLKYAKSALQQTLFEYEAAKDDIELNVITQYLQVLYAREVVKSSQAQVDLSEYQLERQRALANAGKVAEAEVYDLEAQLAQNRLQLVSAQGDARTQLITLANLLQLGDAEGFDIQGLDGDDAYLPAASQVLEQALATNNSILAARAAITAAKDNVAVAKSGWIPKLSFGASTGSQYYSVSGFANESFGNQMRHNYSTYFGFRLSIPIFDAFSTRNSVRRARLQQIQATLEAERRETEIDKTIRLAHTQAVASRDQYKASQESLVATGKAFEAVREKFDLGRATSYELQQASNNLFRTEISAIQARYDYLLRCRILQFYQTGGIS